MLHAQYTKSRPQVLKTHQPHVCEGSQHDYHADVLLPHSLFVDKRKREVKVNRQAKKSKAELIKCSTDQGRQCKAPLRPTHCSKTTFEEAKKLNPGDS